jgi:N-methylhydantoinase B
LKSSLDPLSVAIFEQRIRFVTRYMSELLQRTSRSPTFSLVKDFAIGIYDGQARMLHQTGIPMLSFAIGPSLKHLARYFDGEISPGDVFLHNDVYTGGNQNNDWGIFRPIFCDDKLVAWTATKGHMVDSGGGTAGGYNPAASEIWQESLRITPLKIYEQGRVRKDVWDFVLGNVRHSIVGDDIKAMIGACVIGENQLRKPLDACGWQGFTSYCDTLLSSSEKQVRDAVSRWPDGDCEGASYLNSDGVTKGKKYRIAVKVRKRNSEIKFDFSGTDDQSPSYTNMPISTALGAVAVAYLMVLRPEEHNYFNEGMFAPIATVFRKGSLLNPTFPAATTMGNQMGDQVIDSIMKALSTLLPDKVTAGWHFMCALKWAGIDPRTGDYYDDFGFFAEKGGSGAANGADGIDVIDDSKNGGTIVSQDIELLEATSPVTVLHYEYLPDSAGSGEYRGGLGARTVMRFEGERTSLATFGDGIESEGAEPPYGLAGGRPGTLNKVTLTFPDGREQNMGSKELIVRIPKGTVVEQIVGGGGGYGNPAERARERILQEVKSGLLSREKLRNDYGLEDGLSRA